jgi:hypothetical protein
VFNIMKKKYHKSNTFTFPQLKKALFVDGQIWIVEATPATFKGWDDALKGFYTEFASGTIFKNHIFTCNSTAPTTLTMKEWRDAETDHKKNFVKDARYDKGSLCTYATVGGVRQGPAGSSVYGWRVVFFPSRVSTVRYGTVGGDGTAVITGMKNLGSGAAGGGDRLRSLCHPRLGSRIFNISQRRQQAEL